MHPSWQEKLKPIRQLAINANRKAIADQRDGAQVFPHVADRFNAFNMPYDSVKVVIIGQDPYHGPGQANGLAFSVNKDMQVPPSLVNIYKELHSDIGCPIPNHGDLSAWVEQGVLLLNTSLTVRRGQANSHKDYGWYPFVKEVLSIVAKQNPIFIAWGRHAQDIILGPAEGCYKIKSAHPSPLSAHNGFFGSRPFSKCNEFLKQTNRTNIDWSIT